MEPLKFACTELGQIIRTDVIPCGEDLTVAVRGGIHPHVGSVSVGRGGVLISKWVEQGHRDDAVGDYFAQALSEKTGGTVSVSCGIHYDDPSKEDLKAVVVACEAILDQVIRAVSVPYRSIEHADNGKKGE